jgi:RimJ/RimL family protein N-acetyltransferase
VRWRRVVQRARVNGIARVTATTQWDNRPARALLRRLAFRLRETGDLLEFDLALPRQAVSDARGLAARRAFVVAVS